MGRAKIPWAKEQVIEPSSAQAKLVRRTARRYMQAMNRVRRILRLERLLPTQMPGLRLMGIFAVFEKDAHTQKYFSSCHASYD